MRALFDGRSTLLRTMAVVCPAIAIAVGVFSEWRSGTSTRVAQAATASEQGEAPIAQRAPSDTAPPAPVPKPPSLPVLTMLHGMGSNVARTCERVASAKEAGFVVVCPTGNVDYGDGTADWTGDGEVKATHIDAALKAALGALSIEPSAERGDILMGFSRGAFVARDVAYARANKWRGLVLVGAALTPDAARLRENGIRRVVLASGDFDGAKRTMVAARAKLCAEGMPARFVSLGPVWHDLPADSMKRLADSIAWAHGEGDDRTAGCALPKS